MLRGVAASASWGEDRLGSGLEEVVWVFHMVGEGAVGCWHGAGGIEGENVAATAVAAAIENVGDAAFRRQQAERRVRERQRVPHGGGRRRGGRLRYQSAELFWRSFGIEILVCQMCSEVRRVLSAIHDPAAIARGLGAMGLSATAPEQAGSAVTAGGGRGRRRRRVRRFVTAP